MRRASDSGTSTAALDRVTAWGWDIPAYVRRRCRRRARPTAPRDPPTARVRATPTTSSDTGTNVQEAGVDEPDLVKTDGDLLVRVADGTLKTVRRQRAEPRRLGVAPLDRIGDPQLLLAGDRAVVIGSAVDDPAAGAPLMAPPPRTRVRTFDLATRSRPTLVDSRGYDGSLVTARQTGDAVRLVLDGGLPALDFVTPASSRQRGGGPGPQPGAGPRHHHHRLAAAGHDVAPRRTVPSGAPPRTRSSTAPTSRCPRRTTASAP